MPKLRKVVTVQFVAEVDSDEWAEEYSLDPADVQGIQHDVSQWVRYATDAVLTEMPGNANTLLITEVEVTVASSEAVGEEAPAPVESGRRIRVHWQTEEVREYDEVITVPDGISYDEIPDWIYDGDNSTLVAAEETASYELSTFLRDVDSWELVGN